MEIDLSNSLTPQEIETKIINTPYPDSGSTDTAQGIDMAIYELLMNKKINIPQTFVVLTDGDSNDPSATVLAAERANRGVIRTFAV